MDLVYLFNHLLNTSFKRTQVLFKSLWQKSSPIVLAESVHLDFVCHQLHDVVDLTKFLLQESIPELCHQLCLIVIEPLQLLLIASIQIAE